jgi:hypothetical protein
MEAISMQSTKGKEQCLRASGDIRESKSAV